MYNRGERWRRSPGRAWLLIRTPEHDVVQFDGPVLELMSEGRTRFDRRLSAIGTDIVGDDFDEDAFVRRLREDDPMRRIGDVLLDQRNVAGIGNIWKSKSCFLAGVDPWRLVRAVSDDDARVIVRRARPLMRLSAERGGRIVTVEPERPARRAENRTTYWCPWCQQ